MSVLGVMIRREYLQRVRRRSFLISTLLAPVGLLAAFLVPVFLATHGGGSRKVVVLDQTGDDGLFGALERQVARDTTGTRFNLVREEVPVGSDVDALRRSRTDQLLQDGRMAILVLRADVLDGKAPEYYASSVGDVSLGVLGARVREAIVRARLLHAGLPPGQVESLSSQAGLAVVRVAREGETHDADRNFLVTIFLLATVYITVIGYSGIVAYGLHEEKQSRILEVLITSVEPRQILASKLLGIGLVGLTQYAIWLALLLLAAAAGASNAGIAQLASLGPARGLLGWCVVFFLLGFFLSGTINLILGALASRPEDTALLARPLGLLTFLPWLLFWVVLKDPNGPLAVGLSLFPLFTPTLMMARIASTTVPPGQVILAVAVMLVTISAALWVASRVYRAAILIYGKPITIPEIARSLRGR